MIKKQVIKHKKKNDEDLGIVDYSHIFNSFYEIFNGY
jgi:hypothetical protein